MQFSKFSLGFLAVCLIALFSFNAEANAQNAKFGNFSNCKIELWLGVDDGNGGQYALGPIFLAPNDIYYFTLPNGHFVYKIHFNNTSYVPPAVGTCIATGFRCPARLCTDSPNVWYVL